MSKKTTPRSKFQMPRERLQSLPFARLIPNMATMVALCTGLSAIRFAHMGRFEPAVLAVLVAGFFDAIDGRLARLLGASSDFGAELDSLSDFISFGVAPAVVLYFFGLQAWGGYGWTACLFFAVCMSLRLARFNTMLRSEKDAEDEKIASKYFTGVPAPAGAFLALLPLMISFNMGSGFFSSPWVLWPYLIACGALLVSRLPTYSFKTVQIPRKWVLPMLIAMGLLMALLLNDPWATAALILLAYVGTFFLSYREYKKDLSLKRPRKAVAPVDSAE